jgi:SOS-response transcriptional repressor LexA
MNEKQTSEASTIRPTKKQRELLTFIEQFIGEHGYSPSYREIMNGLNYTSVATVALHVNNLIKRGHLKKRDFNARSLEVVVSTGAGSSVTTNQVAPGEEKWLIEKIEHRFAQSATAAAVESAELKALETLIEALRVLGLESAAQSFLPKLTEVRNLPRAVTESHE